MLSMGHFLNAERRNFHHLSYLNTLDSQTNLERLGRRLSPAERLGHFHCRLLLKLHLRLGSEYEFVRSMNHVRNAERCDVNLCLLSFGVPQDTEAWCVALSMLGMGRVLIAERSDRSKCLRVCNMVVN